MRGDSLGSKQGAEVTPLEQVSMEVVDLDPLLVRILKMGGPGPPGLSSTKCRPGGPGPPPGPPHFENADKEGPRSRTSMETYSYARLVMA